MTNVLGLGCVGQRLPWPGAGGERGRHPPKTAPIYTRRYPSHLAADLSVPGQTVYTCHHAGAGQMAEL